MTGKCPVTAPPVVMRPIELGPSSKNQRAPSDPTVIPPGWVPAGRGNSSIAPAAAGVARAVIRAAVSPRNSLASGIKLLSGAGDAN